MVYSYAAEKNIHIKLANNGDDCVVMMEKEHEQNFMKGLDDWFMDMGFRMTAEAPVYRLAEIEFCQMRPIEYGNGEVMMVRNIPTSLRKDTLCSVDISKEKTMKAWMTAVGKGGLSLTGGIPIVQNFYRSFIRLGEGVSNNMAQQLNRNSGMYLLGTGMDRKFKEPTAEARLNTYIAWGITPDQQVALEQYYDEFDIESYKAVGVDKHINLNPIFHVLSR